MEKTTNLGLSKPAQEDFYNVDDFNANCDILDNAIKTNDDNAVHKSGDETIDGVKTFKKATILNSVVRDDTSHSLVLCGGTDGNNGAYLELVGKDVENANGVFSLHANDGTNNVALFGNAKGDLIWNGQNIIRSINGVEADTNGNINLDDTTDSYVLKSGDTVNGTLTFSTINAINCNVDTQRIDIYGGITWLRGGGVSVIGKGATENAGNFDVWASDGTNHKHLVGKPNGELTWDLKHVVRSVNGNYADENGNIKVALGGSFFPDYKALISRSKGTAETNGYIFIAQRYGGSGQGTVTVSVDGVTLQSIFMNDYDSLSITVPIGKGSTYSVSGASSVLFVPCQ